MTVPRPAKIASHAWRVASVAGSASRAAMSKSFQDITAK